MYIEAINIEVDKLPEFSTNLKNVDELYNIILEKEKILDLEKAIDYSPLEEWDNISVVIKVTAEYQLKEGLMLGGEFGANRLYYWEYKWSDGFYSGTRYRSEWTTNLGVHITKYFGEVWFVQGGAAVHIFNDGSGTVVGLLAATGADLTISDKLKIPLALRIEPVFFSDLFE